jgi:hypothetical protein
VQSPPIFPSSSHKVRVHHQSEGGEADRINNSTERFSTSRQGNPMIPESKIANPKSKIEKFPEHAGAGGPHYKAITSIG